MAICFWDAKILWDAHLKGASFEKVATIGHLSLYLHPSEVSYFRRQYRKHYPHSASEPLKDYKFGDYSDGFLTAFLGVVNKTIIDASAYEGADAIQDLNQPIPEDLKNKFDAVIDCGTLEHVFNFPTAISNLMNMTRVGGSIFISTPSNNLSGHGFYQFSPELMFRIFTKENGFNLKRIVATEGVFPSFEMSPHRAAYEVADPENVHSRVGLLSHGPVTMIVEATKIKNTALFAKYPLQSDYVSLWKGVPSQAHSKEWLKRMVKSIYEKIPPFISIWIAGIRQRNKFSLSNKNYYKKLE